MPVHVVQPMVQTIESILTGDLAFKGKDFNQSRQFYEKQMELLKNLKSSFYPDNENVLNNSQLYPTANTSFTLTVSELHSIIPLGRTAGALREGWTGIMRDHLRRIIPHTTWYFKRSAFSHPETRKRAAPLFKCEAVCAERTCPNTIKMCATKSDPLRVNVKFGQGMCIHLLRKRVMQTTHTDRSKTGSTIAVDAKTPTAGVHLASSYSCLTPPSPPLLHTPVLPSSTAAVVGLPTPPSPILQSVGCPVTLQCPPSLMVCERKETGIRRPVALRITQEDRKRSYCRLRSNEDQDAPSAFHIVTSPTKRLRVDLSPTTPPLIPSLLGQLSPPLQQTLLDQTYIPVPTSDVHNIFNLDKQRKVSLDRGIAT